MAVPIKMNDPAHSAGLSPSLPLCVDLDGTLVLTDVLLEAAVLLVKRQPHALLLMPFWLLGGKAAFKSEIARRVALAPELLPYNQLLLQWLKAQQALGRPLWLCTGAHEIHAAKIAENLEIFDGVLASNRSTNLAGSAKAELLVERFGEQGFDYCGNEWRDLLVWRRARGAIVVHQSDRLLRTVARHARVIQTFHHRSMSLRALFRALRPNQWAKNVLVGVPLLAAHQADDPARVIVVLLAIVAFCLCASSVYVANDLLDLTHDRMHPRKCRRPFAAGDLPLSLGLLIIPMLLGGCGVVILLLPLKFQLSLIAYYALTLAYSFVMKGMILIDVLTLACLYTLRIIAGAFVADVGLSFWLMWFSMFLFLSLAFVKRYAELDAMRRMHRLSAAGRGYAVEDLPVLQSLGAAAGYLSVVVLALYVNSPIIDDLYRRPIVIWPVCVLLLFWISRVWMLAQRGEMLDDPVVFALTDRASQVVGMFVVLAVLAAI